MGRLCHIKIGIRFFFIAETLSEVLNFRLKDCENCYENAVLCGSSANMNWVIKQNDLGNTESEVYIKKVKRMTVVIVGLKVSLKE